MSEDEYEENQEDEDEENEEEEKEIDPAVVLDLETKIKLLWQFLAQLIPHRNLLKEVLGLCGRNESRVSAAAIVITALGGDWEGNELEAKVRRERAEALLNLVDVLIRTEKERKEYAEKKRIGQENIRKFLMGGDFK